MSLYRNAVEALHEVAPEEPEAQLDKGWVDATDGANKKETTRLENELRGYKNNLVKESVRVSFPTSQNHRFRTRAGWES